MMTQPVYEADLFRDVPAAVAPVEVPILIGILPVPSYRHALFTHDTLPGVKLTEDALYRMEMAGANGVKEDLALTREMIEPRGHMVAGLYIIPSFGRYEVAGKLVSEPLVPA